MFISNLFIEVDNPSSKENNSTKLNPQWLPVPEMYLNNSSSTFETINYSYNIIYYNLNDCINKQNNGLCAHCGIIVCVLVSTCV